MAQKSNIVYFLGAGCSKNFGYPLTGDIMPDILKNLKAHDLFHLDAAGKTASERQQEKDLQHFLELLYPGLKNIDLVHEKNRIPSIVEVLSFVDHLCFYNIPPHPELNEEKLGYLRYLLNRAVAELMMDYQNMDFKDNEEYLLKLFTKPIANPDKPSNITIITTNYDLAIDPTFQTPMVEHKVDYGISFRDTASSEIIPQPHQPLFRYYKLHGSLNWLRCDLCGHYYINPYGSIAFQAFKDEIDDGNTCICNSRLRLKPVLITPSLVRDIRDANLLQIWKAATESIRTADRIIFIGYSLPAEDLAIKTLILRGINGREKAHSLAVDVVQFGTAAAPNYLNLMGDGIVYHKQGLEDYLLNRQGAFVPERVKH